MKRIFTAVDISETARGQCAEYIENLRGDFSDLRVGWEKREKLHLTLKFLGDIDEKQLQNLIEAVDSATQQYSNFKLRLAKTGVFPSARNARILWLGVADGAENLRQLNQFLEKECEQRGFAEEKRNFKAHLTVARLREPHKSAQLVEKHLRTEFESSEFTVSGVTIYESVLQKSGSVYSIISEHRFNRMDKIISC